MLGHGDADPPVAGHLGRLVVARVDVADHAHTRVVGEDALQFGPGQRGAVGDADLPGVDGPADADPAAVVHAYPRRTRGRVDQGVEDRPVGYRVGAVGHALGLPVWRGDRAAVQVVAAEHDRRPHLAAG